jgi:hypothetical protein
MKRLSLIILCIIWPILLSAQTDVVTFSQPGGFYDEIFLLTLRCSEGHHIRYTTNGNTPDSHSKLYSGPLIMNSSQFSKSNIYTIVNCIPSVFYLPDYIKRAIVIRAAVFDSNEVRVSPVVTNSYFIKELGCDLHDMPVVSIVTDSLSLFDYETGIFIPGINYDPADSTHTGNYCQTGKEWERLINFEFYEPDNTGVNQQCGLRTHGGASRWFQQKGLKVYARDEYGTKRFNHNFFENTPFNSFKHLNLHPFRCSNWLQTGGQEYLSQSVAANLNFESLAVRQTVVFINGEYWGIYTMEESPDERYLEDHFGVYLDQVSIIKYWGVPQYGDPADWRAFRSWISHADLSQPEDSAYAYSRIDVSSFIDYLVFETYTANLDWPQNNVLHWSPEPGTQFRWIFFDGDGCFSRSNYNAIERMFNVGGNGLLFMKFLDNQSFRDSFIKHYQQLKATAFNASHLTSIRNRYQQIVDGEIASQASRFRFPYHYERWLTDMNKLDEFFNDRSNYFESELYTFISVGETSIACFACIPNPSSGTFTIQFNSQNSTVIPLEIYDIMGRKVLSENIYATDGNNSISLQVSLSAGLYLLKFDNHTERIVIQ